VCLCVCTDVSVEQASASERIEPPEGFLCANCTGAGGHWDSAFALQDFMDDEYIPQYSMPASPRSHRLHTDFDLQGIQLIYLYTHTHTHTHNRYIRMNISCIVPRALTISLRHDCSTDFLIFREPVQD
jgi:hypothetical protein